jgi:hypothetical protein
MLSEAHRKITKSDALAGNTHMEDSAVLRGELGMAGRAGFVLKDSSPPVRLGYCPACGTCKLKGPAM